MEGRRDDAGGVAEDPAAPGSQHQPPVAVFRGRLQDPLGTGGKGGGDTVGLVGGAGCYHSGVRRG